MTGSSSFNSNDFLARRYTSHNLDNFFTGVLSSFELLWSLYIITHFLFLLYYLHQLLHFTYAVFSLLLHFLLHKTVIIACSQFQTRFEENDTQIKFRSSWHQELYLHMASPSMLIKAHRNWSSSRVSCTSKIFLTLASPQSDLSLQKLASSPFVMPPSRTTLALLERKVRPVVRNLIIELQRKHLY